MKVYPKPMFDFNERRQICIDAIKDAYRHNLYGDDKKVLDGSWRALFEDSAEGPTEGKNEKDGANDTHRVKRSDDIGTDMGEDPDEGEDAEIGGESKSGDRPQQNPVKKGEPQTPQKRKGQGTLDGHVSGGRGKRKKA